MELDCYKIYESAPEIIPGRHKRDWMDAFPDNHPYRCLPLTMANTSGWEILCPMDVKIVWDGGEAEEAIQFYTTGDPAWIRSFVDSHFRRGIVTFHTGHLFRTPPGWGVWTTGAPNFFKDGIAPLTGLVETDWLPFPFTMNWQLTCPGKEVIFRKGEPFCFMTLMEHGKLDQVEPKLRMLSSNSELEGDYQAWQSSRADFNARLKSREESATAQGWQRHYMQGKKHSGEKGDGHVTKRRLKPPVDV